MNVVEYGKENAEVILLLHGGGLSWWNYMEAAELLSARFYVVIPVLDGHAESDQPFTTIESNASRIIQYIDEMFGGHVLLIGGLSLGGQILVEILSQRSTICDFAIIESALVLPMKLTAALIRPAFSLCYPLIGKRWFSKLQFWSLHIKPLLFERYYQDTVRIAKNDMISFLTANANYRIKETLAACKAKVLILAGSRERPIMKRSAKVMAAYLSTSTLEMMKGLRHGELSMNHARQYAEKLLHLIDNTNSSA